MPRYRDINTGEILTQEQFDALSEQPRLFQGEQKEGLPSRIFKGFMGLQKAQVEPMIGGAKGLGETLTSLGQLGLKGAEKLPLPEQIREPIRGGIEMGEELKERIFKPTTPLETIGKTTEQIGEFFMPIGGEVRAAQFLSKILPQAPKLLTGLTKMIGAGAEFAGKTAIQTGAEPRETGISGVIGAISPVAGRIFKTTQKTVTEALPERLMSVIFKTAEDDLRAMYRSISKGEEINPTLAREVLERGLKGNPQNMAVYSFQKLNQLENQVQQTVKQLGEQGKTISLENKQGYLNILKTVRDNFKGDFMTERATNAQKLINELNQIKGNNTPVDLALRLRRFIDTMRNTSSFRLNMNLIPKQEGFKAATNSLRKKIADIGLKTLMNEERIYINALDEIISNAAKGKNKNVLGLFDLIAGGGGLASGNIVGGFTTGVAVRLFQQPFSLTNMAQALYKMRNLPNVAAGLKVIPPLSPRVIEE